MVPPPPAAEGLLSGGAVRRVEVPCQHLGVAAKHLCEQLVEPSGDVEVEPPVTARRALLHGHAKDDGHVAISLGELGPVDGLAVALITAFASHQRLLR
jgi:hypothetical protein